MLSNLFNSTLTGRPTELMGAIRLLLVLKNKKIMSYVRTIRGMRSPGSPLCLSLFIKTSLFLL